MLFLTILGAMLGGALASFGGVVFDRVPRGESILRPASACAACAARINWHDNVPVLSWLALQGRCRICRTKIPLKLFVLEIVGTLLGFAIALSSFHPR
jgi:prepilin signal peptidase PulO-like enzyme (type II secretory pathway)